MGALCARLVRTLNDDPTSPFFQRVVLHGITPNEGQNLTIPEAVKGFVQTKLLGRSLHRNFVHGPLSGPTDGETIGRARKVINGYFNMVKAAHPERWEAGRSAHICVNPGIRAHLLIIAEILGYIENKKRLDPHVMTEEEILTELSSMIQPVRKFIGSVTDLEIQDEFSRKFGEGGVLEYYYSLCEIINREFSEFGSEEFKKFVAQKSDARVAKGNEDIIDLHREINDYFVKVLKRVYGVNEMPSGEKAYWELGIQSSKAKEGAYRRQQEEPVERRLPKEAYLNVLDLRDAIRDKKNWRYFEDVFNIPMRDEKRGKAYYLTWMVEFNELRRIPSHASPWRVYTEDHFEFLEWLKGEFYNRLAKMTRD